jgi:hypothetical protein
LTKRRDVIANWSRRLSEAISRPRAGPDQAIGDEMVLGQSRSVFVNAQYLLEGRNIIQPRDDHVLNEQVELGSLT